jgi:hypothetical protein
MTHKALLMETHSIAWEDHGDPAELAACLNQYEDAGWSVRTIVEFTRSRFVIVLERPAP